MEKGTLLFLKQLGIMTPKILELNE